MYKEKHENEFDKMTGGDLDYRLKKEEYSQ